MHHDISGELQLISTTKDAEKDDLSPCMSLKS